MSQIESYKNALEREIRKAVDYYKPTIKNDDHIAYIIASENEVEVHTALKQLIEAIMEENE